MTAKQSIGASGLHREIGAIQATALVAGGTIGTSIFIIPSAVAQSAGTPISALAIWVAAGLLALIASLCLAELSSVIPQAGGTYAFLKRAYPFPVIPFSFAWMMCFAYGPGAMAVVATMSAGFVSPYLKAALHLAHDPARPVALAMLLGAGAVNAFGVRIGGAAQTLLTVVKVALLVSLIAAAFIFLRPSLEGLFAATAAPEQRNLSLTSVTSALMLCMFSYSGSHFVTLVGGEVRNPERVIPLAIFFGAAIVMTLYLALNAAIFLTLPFEQIAGSKRISFELMDAALGPAGAAFAALAVFVSGAAVLNAQCLGYPRILFSLAQDGLFFRAAAQVHPRTGSPIAAIAIFTMVAMAYVFSGSYSEILGYVAFVSQLFTVLMVVGVILMRRREPALPRPYRAWGYPWTPILFILVMAAYLASLLITKTSSVLVGIGVVAAGLPFYAFARGRARRGIEREPAAEEWKQGKS